MSSVAEARCEIINLLWRYANAIDLYANADGEVEGWLETLTPEAAVECPMSIPSSDLLFGMIPENDRSPAAHGWARGSDACLDGSVQPT